MSRQLWSQPCLLSRKHHTLHGLTPDLCTLGTGSEPQQSHVMHHCSQIVNTPCCSTMHMCLICNLFGSVACHMQITRADHIIQTATATQMLSPLCKPVFSSLSMSLMLKQLNPSCLLTPSTPAMPWACNVVSHAGWSVHTSSAQRLQIPDLS